MVKSNNLFPPQEYIALVTGNYYIVCTGTIEWIHGCLSHNNLDLWDYPLDEIDHIVENKIPVVLVDCSHYEGDVYVTELRWFEVPEDIEINEEVL